MSIDAARFQRQMQLPRFGAEGQARLARARVLVAGCGALGTVVAEQLARAGVGTLVIVDRDIVEWSNLQRQTLFTEADARRGVPKAEAAKARLAQVHGGTVARAFVDDLHGANALRYASEADLIVDCLDNGDARRIVQAFARANGIPCLHGALAANGVFARVVWDEMFVIDDIGQGTAATCEDGGFLPFIGVASCYLALSIQKFLQEGRRLSFSISPEGVQKI
jgi:adenylyltransferase/sulfurtransferase